MRGFSATIPSLRGYTAGAGLRTVGQTCFRPSARQDSVVRRSTPS